MARRPRFRDLTEFQRKSLCNGCGRKGAYVGVPNLVFRRACNRHDFRYWIGGGKAARLKADLMFLKDMQADAWNNSITWSGYGLYLSASWAYYRAVRRFGSAAFHWGTPRTVDDLPQPSDESLT